MQNSQTTLEVSTAILYWTYRAGLTNDPSFRVNPKMNDSEAACFGGEALEYRCSVCDFVRLAVRPVNSDFVIFIRILFYLNNKWREDTRKLSRPRHVLVNTKTTTGSSETWSICSFFWGGGGGGGGGWGRPSPNDNDQAYFAVIIGSQFVSDFKTKHTVTKPVSLAKREWLVGENPRRNDSVTVVRN